MAAVLLKVFGLVLRTAAKPLGHQFQAWALEHPGFRRGAVSLAQFLHSSEVWITRGAEGKEGKAFVGSMTDERALEMASKVVSEGFVFTVGVGVLSWEYYRSKIRDMEKAALDERNRKELIMHAKAERERLEASNMALRQVIQELANRVDYLELDVHNQRPQVRPWWQVWQSSTNEQSNKRPQV